MLKVVSLDIWRTLLDLDAFYCLIAEKLSELASKDYESIRDKMFEAYREALKARLKGEFKRPVYDSARFFSSILGVNVEELFRATVMAVLDDRAQELKFPDVDPAIKELKKMKSLKIALLGNVLFWPGMITRVILEKNGILQYVDVTLFGDELGVQKPSREIFETLANLTDSNINEIIHVGDSLTSDFSGALLSGARAALIKRDLKEEVLSLSEKAYVIKDLRALINLIPQL